MMFWNWLRSLRKNLFYPSQRQNHRSVRWFLRPSLEELEHRLAPALTITPITWDEVGLDSNNVTVGPNQYLVGARVTTTGGSAVSNVTATFNLGTYGGATPNDSAPIITSGTGTGLPTIHQTT